MRALPGEWRNTLSLRVENAYVSGYGHNALQS